MHIWIKVLIAFRSISIRNFFILGIISLAFTRCLNKGDESNNRKSLLLLRPEIVGFLQDTNHVNVVVDSLKNKINEAKYDSVVVVLLAEISSNLNPPLNFIFANESIDKSREIGFKYGEMNGLLYLGKCYEKANKTVIADSILSLCLKKASENNYWKLRMHTLQTIGKFKLNKHRYAEAIECHTKALELSKKMHDTAAISICLSDIGHAYYYLNEYKNALDNLFKALEFNNGSSLTNEINILNRIAQVYYMKDDYSNSLKYYLMQLKLAVEVNDQISITRSYGLIGELYRLLGDYQKAIDYYQWSLKRAIELKDVESEVFTYNCLGEVYYVQKKYEEALNSFEKAMPLALEIEDSSSYGYALNMAGIVYTETGDVEKGLIYHKNALKIFTNINDFVSATTANIYLATDYIELKDYQKAYSFVDLALSSSKKHYSLDNLKDCYLLYSKIYEEKGLPRESMESYKMYIIYKDSLFNNEKSKSFASVELKERESQLNAEQEKKDAIHNAEQTKQEEALKREKIIKYCLSIGAVLLILLAFVIYRSLKESRRSKLIIQGQKEEVEIQKKLIEEKNKEVLDSINYAKRIQYALLAHKEFLRGHLPEHFILFKPKDIVSGDFYWASEKNGKFYLAVCDSTGHGVPGAFMSLLNIGFLSEAINEKNIEKPNEIFNYVRKRLIESLSQDEGKDGMDGILICIDGLSKNISYSAANNAPVLVSDKKLFNLQKDKMPVGKTELLNSFELFTIEYKPGDIIYLFTDGYADQFGGPKGKKFKYKQLEQALIDVSSQSIEAQGLVLDDNISSWRGTLEQVDDILIVGIKL